MKTVVRAGSLLLGLLMLSIAYVMLSPKQASLEVIFLNVGQGDATLVRTPNGQSLLIDGGKSGTRLVGLLHELEIERLDLMIASHADYDHIGGLAAAATTFKPRYFIDNTIPHTTQAYERLLQNVLEVNATLLPPTYQSFRLGRALITILPPPAYIDAAIDWDDQNDNSVGVIVRYGEFAVLINGDATDREQDYWLERYPEAFEDIEIYRSAHHGSGTGDMGAILRLVRPDAIVVSVGKDNPYGHPNPETYERYLASGAEIYRTDQDGHIAVAVTKGGHLGYNISTGTLYATAKPRVAQALVDLLDLHP